MNAVNDIMKWAATAVATKDTKKKMTLNYLSTYYFK